MLNVKFSDNNTTVSDNILWENGKKKNAISCVAKIENAVIYSSSLVSKMLNNLKVYYLLVLTNLDQYEYWC